ncbi:uncharacterized protein BDR25DRAFT_333249 [Lindgomyces ingoldianus]|uniref:Uncharacterized protein n=1 Tax=Lindgomyces ingoldianus TaxID=673940 RepID=A0ACB6QZ70_9PLEO|nr:uncharacterized protein BDR25DRAFT_333249 [Lindgomyces ingoldianus]KAF2472344.1 hypothetical protein BDR25DRAFT_333249 [Lindgomyces ingoldianus]
MPHRRPLSANDLSNTSQSLHLFSPKTSVTERLGIKNAPAIRPHAALDLVIREKDDSLPNIAQRIEKKLWRYNSSGNVVARWLLEIISWIIGALCMAAIVGILWKLNGKKVPRWPLNTYIAVLSKIASASLIFPISEALGQLKWSWFRGDSKRMWDFEIFDNASRGPWGSFLLLTRTKCKTFAALGAALTLVSLTLDPFFQQVVDLPSRWTLQGNSSIPTVTRYEPHFGDSFQAGKPILQLDQDLQATALKFFYNEGMKLITLGNGTRPNIPLFCLTSNCTWPPYETLGICSACEGISQSLTYACLTSRIDWFGNLTGVGTESSYPNGTSCGYFLNATSDAPVLMSGYSVDAVNLLPGEALVMRTLPLVDLTRRPLVYRNETPIAHECMLSWCVQTIMSSYYWANYSEGMANTFFNTTPGPFPWGSSFTINSTAFNATQNTYLFNTTLNSPSTGNRKSFYGVSPLTALQTILIFDDILPSFLTVPNASAIPILRNQIGIRGGPRQRTLEFDPWIAPNNVTQHLERLARALTNVIRSSTSAESITGEAFSMETYVSVRWEWLLIPLGVLFFSLIFLVGTIVKSSREMEQVGIRKTSALATLLYGLPDDMQKKITASTAVGTPRAKAKELKVKLLPKMGWRVSGNLFSPTRLNVRQNMPPPGWI